MLNGCNFFLERAFFCNLSDKLFIKMQGQSETKQESAVSVQSDSQNGECFQRSFKNLSTQKSIKSTIAKRLDFIKDPKLSESEYERLWLIIKRDQVDALALLMEEQKNMEDPFYQISAFDQNENWNFPHFCCQYNSVRCLEWILTFAFFAYPEKYISFVNAKTSDQQTALAIAIVQGSTDCYNLLLKNGGIDLNVKIRKQSYLQIAAANKRKDIYEKLKKLEKAGVFYLNVQDNQMNVQKLSNALQQQRQQAITRIRVENDKFDIMEFVTQVDQDLDNKIKEAKLRYKQYKQQLNKRQQQWDRQTVDYEETLKHQKQLLRIVLKEQRKSLDRQQYVRKRADSSIKIRKNQSQKRLFLQNHQKIKQNLMRQHKLKDQNDLNVKKRERIQKLNRQQEKRLLQKSKNQLQRRIKLIQIQKGRIHSTRQNIIKRVTEENGKMESSLKKKMQKEKQYNENIEKGNLKTRTYGSLEKLPDQIKQIYKQIRGNFKDPLFLAEECSLGENIPDKLKHAVWIRPKDIFQTNQFSLFESIGPNNILQGHLGVCYYLSTISCLAENPERIRNLFAFADIDKGFYVMAFFVTGKPSYVIVDDYFPCNKMTKAPLFSKPKGKQVWVMILQKAWVKQFGTYLNAQAMSADTMMQNVTGAPSKGLWLKKQFKDQIFNQMLQYKGTQSIMVATSKSEQIIPGIDFSHAYSLISVYSFKQHKILKLRNPWGQFEWDGQYCQNSDRWTQQLKQRVSYDEAISEGMFFISLNEFLTAFEYLSIGIIKKGFVVGWKDIEPIQEDQFFQFTIKKQGPLNLRVCQPFRRFNPSIRWKQYRYSPFVFEVIDLSRMKFIAQGSHSTNFGAKSVHWHQRALIDVKPGSYLIRLKFFSQLDPMPVFTLCTYSQTQIKLNKIQKDEGFKKWSKAMANYMSQQEQIDEVNEKVGYAIKWMKGQLLIYVQGPQSQSIKFKFDNNCLKNCVPGFRKVQGTRANLIVPCGQVGTLDKIVIKQAAGTGCFKVEII